jgi:hypothetical protein
MCGLVWIRGHKNMKKEICKKFSDLYFHVPYCHSGQLEKDKALAKTIKIKGNLSIMKTPVFLTNN